jgi:transcriptional regulator with XRE-family HTH domain
MPPLPLRDARLAKQWTQTDLAKRLGVSQAYVAMLENGKRQPSRALAELLVGTLGLSPEALPTTMPPSMDAGELSVDLANLGYPGFQRLRSSKTPKNPAVVLFGALRQEGLEPRLAEALPWVLLQFPDLDWEWLVPLAKQHDLQNRLGFVVSLARRLAQRRNPGVSARLRQRELALERSRLAAEDVFGRSKLTETERRWLRENRSAEAAHWNVLTGLRPESLTNVI